MRCRDETDQAYDRRDRDRIVPDILLVWAIAVLARYSTALLWIAVAVVAIVVTRKCSSRATHRQVRRELNSE
jgi:ABC-type bacteriocin/lantibiotic exporter with double-glycine peptidase domain